MAECADVVAEAVLVARAKAVVVRVAFAVACEVAATEFVIVFVTILRILFLCAAAVNYGFGLMRWRGVE